MMFYAFDCDGYESFDGYGLMRSDGGNVRQG